MPSWWTAPAHDETALVDADPRGSRRRSDPADFRVAPDPPGHGEAPHFHGKRLAEVSRYLEHSSTDVTRRCARQTRTPSGRRAAEALERAGLVAI
jgi:hypothetical protein